jgi:hypothetical protein
MHLRNNRGLRPQFPTVEEFTERARNHFLGSYSSLNCAYRDLKEPAHVGYFVDGLVAEKELYEIAWHGGDLYMIALANVLADLKTQLAAERTAEEAFMARYVAAQKVTHGGMKFTLSEFIRMMEVADWSYRESDDAKMYASGKAIADDVNEIVANNPSWKPFYDFKLQEIEAQSTKK